jgi:hypothetical protein
VNTGEGMNGSVQPKGSPKAWGAWSSSIFGHQASTSGGACLEIWACISAAFPQTFLASNEVGIEGVEEGASVGDIVHFNGASFRILNIISSPQYFILEPV